MKYNIPRKIKQINNQNSNSLDELLVAHHGQRQPQELPVGLLALLEHLGRDLEARRSVGTGGDAGHVDGGFGEVVVVLEDGLVLRVPEGHGALHVPEEGGGRNESGEGLIARSM